MPVLLCCDAGGVDVMYVVSSYIDGVGVDVGGYGGVDVDDGVVVCGVHDGIAGIDVGVSVVGGVVYGVGGAGVICVVVVVDVGVCVCVMFAGVCVYIGVGVGAVDGVCVIIDAGGIGGGIACVVRGNIGCIVVFGGVDIADGIGVGVIVGYVVVGVVVCV